jgi:hypothetical protein
MAAATAQGTYINPMAALASQIPHATLNGMANPVVPPTSGKYVGDLAGFVCISQTPKDFLEYEIKIKTNLKEYEDRKSKAKQEFRTYLIARYIICQLL